MNKNTCTNVNKLLKEISVTNLLRPRLCQYYFLLFVLEVEGRERQNAAPGMQTGCSFSQWCVCVCVSVRLCVWRRLIDAGVSELGGI